MKGRAGFILLFSLVIFPLVQGCRASSESAPSPQPPASPSPASEPQTSLDQQARKQAEEFWATKFARCGNSFYAIDRSTIVQLKGAAILVAASPLTQADRQNGIEWKGKSEITADTSRHISSGRDWSQWQNGHGFPIGLVVLLQKQKGAWDVRINEYSEVGSLKAISCSDGNNPEQLFGNKRDEEIENKRAQAAETGFYSSNIPRDMFEDIYSFHNQYKFNFATFTPSGGWIVVLKTGTCDYSDLPDDAIAQIKRLTSVRQAAFSPTGGWLLITGSTGYASDGVPDAMLKKLAELYKTSGASIESVAFHPNGGWVVAWKVTLPDYRGYRWFAAHEGIPADVASALQQVAKQNQRIKQVTFMPTGGWIILFGKNGFKSNGIPEAAVQALNEINGKDKEIYNVAFGPDEGWVVVSQGKYKY